MTPQETDQDLPMSVQESLAEAWVGSGLGWQWPGLGSGLAWAVAWMAGLRALNVAVCECDLLKEVSITFITSTIVWLQVKQQGGNIVPPINRKLN